MGRAQNRLISVGALLTIIGGLSRLQFMRLTHAMVLITCAGDDE